MYIISEAEFKKILKDKFRAIVGEQCKRLEIIRDNKEIPESAKINLIKDLIKELNYESMRDLELQVKCFSNGLKYFKVNMNKPIS